MKLTTIMHVTVDGVMQGLGGPDEDRRGGFERGGWQMRPTPASPRCPWSGWLRATRRVPYGQPAASTGVSTSTSWSERSATAAERRSLGIATYFGSWALVRDLVSEATVSNATAGPPR